MADWPITKFYNSRVEFISALSDYTLDRLIQKNPDLTEVVAKTIFQEKKRAKNDPWKVDPPDEYAVWNKFGQSLAKAKVSDNVEEEVKAIARRIISRYTEEILGGFQPKAFKIARIYLTSIFKRLFNKIRFPYIIRSWGSKEELLNKLNITGSVEETRSLFKNGTVVLVPTHFSNLDSILLGYFIDMKLGIPAFSWGAGLNLFDYELLAYFMNRLGTYRVDRRKKNPIYLEALKAKATLSMHVGLNNIFFPGGTRSRSGALESKLKLGLMQSTIEAQRLNLRRNIDKKIFVIPVIMGYHFVLEANSLIEQHLKITGQEKYTPLKTKESKLKKVAVVINNLMKGETDVSMHFCKPMDILGNPVNKDGDSIGINGEILNLEDYYAIGDSESTDTQRERVYTQLLGNRILEAYKRENVVISSHLLAFVLFNMYQRMYPELSIYQLVNQKHDIPEIEREDLLNEMRHLIKNLKQKGNINLTEVVHSGAEKCLEEGLNKLGLFHRKKPVLELENKNITTQSLKLLYFYHNRLTNFGFEQFLGKTDKISS